MKVRKSVAGSIWFILAASAHRDVTDYIDRLQYQAVEQGSFPKKLYFPIRIRPPPVFAAV
jgi:hypothetical protein